MTKMKTDPWGLDRVVDFFSKERSKPEDVYRSEALFLNAALTENISILDVGCAQGGFSEIVATKIKNFTYTGLDQSPAMIEKAKKKSKHQFICADLATEIPEQLKNRKFDLVLCLGVLHLTLDWRALIKNCWACSETSFIFDLRESSAPTIEDVEESYFKMDFNGADAIHSETRLPYVIVNSSDVQAYLETVNPNLEQFGYTHAPRDSSHIPIKNLWIKSYHMKREKK